MLVCALSTLRVLQYGAMVSVGRLDWLQRQLHGGRNATVRFSFNTDTSTERVQFVLEERTHRPALIHRPALMATIDAVREAASSNVITDKGHKSSSGTSVVQFWIKPPNECAPTVHNHDTSEQSADVIVGGQGGRPSGLGIANQSDGNSDSVDNGDNIGRNDVIDTVIGQAGMDNGFCVGSAIGTQAEDATVDAEGVTVGVDVAFNVADLAGGPTIPSVEEVPVTRLATIIGAAQDVSMASALAVGDCVEVTRTMECADKSTDQDRQFMPGSRVTITHIEPKY